MLQSKFLKTRLEIFKLLLTVFPEACPHHLLLPCLRAQECNVNVHSRTLVEHQSMEKVFDFDFTRLNFEHSVYAQSCCWSNTQRHHIMANRLVMQSLLDLLP